MTDMSAVIQRDSDPRLRPSEALAYWAGFASEHYIRLPCFSRLRSGVTTRLLQRHLPEQGRTPVPTIDPTGITPEQFQDDYIKPNLPVVLKGAAANWPAVRKWTPEFFQTNYGSDTLCVRVETRRVGVESVYARDVTLSELIDDVRNGGEYYASNLEDLFNDHPSLREDLLLRELERYSCAHPLRSAPRSKKAWRSPRFGEIHSTQIFITNANGRTGYHCEPGGNFFVQVYGRRHWVFVDPRHTPFMYPILRKDFVYSGSPVDDRLGRDALMAEGYGLYNLIPKYEVVLDPGDVLLSPQWWWHTVDNLGASIGVALRFRTHLFAGSPVFSAMTMLSPTLWRHLLQMVRTGWGADATGARRFFEPEGAEVKVRFSSSKAVPMKGKAAS